jgi:uroporphyrinogen-III decarboxylase
MMAAFRGEPVDRVPIWLREGFDFHHPIPRADDFLLGWRADPDYVALYEVARRHCDMRVEWGPPGLFNRTLSIPPQRMTEEGQQVSADVRRIVTTIDTPRGTLTGVREQRRGEAHSWTTKYPVESREDLEKLRSVPFEVGAVDTSRYDGERALLGDRGVMCLVVSSPWVVFSTTMPFELALEWSLSERAMVHEILEEITQRVLAGLEAVFERDYQDMIANIGGSEQCTPPIMGPAAYRELVTPYEARIADFLSRHGVPLNCHCHSMVRDALPAMVDAGMSATDPVEPPPMGNVTAAEARDLVGDRLTLCENLEWQELVESPPGRIRDRVREITNTGKKRLVIGSSAGPISRMTAQQIRNYREWIDAALEYGQYDSRL